MVKLVAIDSPGDAWYFRTMKQCEKFKSVFENYGCNVRWDEPIEADCFPEMDNDDWSEIYEKPKKRANRALPWAYSLIKQRQLAAFMESVMYQRFSDEQKIVIRALTDIL